MSNIAEFPSKLQPLFRPHRYKVAYGGRGGAKSWGFARALLIMGCQRPLRILCARELQISIQDSVHRLLSDQIHAMGLDGNYEIQQQTIRGTNGTEFLFAGIRNNVTKIKSMEGIDICWVEEAEKVSNDSWDVLIPTIRKDGSEIWVSFNPHEETDPTYQRFVVNPPPSAWVVKLGWEDNPWFPAELRAEKDYLYSVDPEAAAHVWGGECRNVSDAQILRGRFRVESFEPLQWWHGPYQGADWGFAQDPTALVRCYIDGRTLYVRHEAYGIGVEIDYLPALFDQVQDARKILTRADNARPETISYMQRNGFNMMAAEKWPGSVEDGVEFLRSFESIIIHPECRHTAEEARLYSYKTDKLSGQVMPEILDRHNHCLVAGTMVSTSKGQIPIEDVVVGDMVWTRNGLRKVKWSGVSGTSRKVMTIKTASGMSLTGTPDHNIFADGLWKSIDDLRYGSILVSGEIKCGKHSNTVGSFIIDTQNPDGEQIGTITLRRLLKKCLGKDFCTGKSGLMPKARYHKGTTYTTLMGTQVITIYPTSSASQSVNIHVNTWMTIKGLSRLIGLIQSGILHRHGIRLKKAGNGIANMLKKFLGRLCRGFQPVTDVAIPMKASAHADFVAMPASRHGEESTVWTISTSNAKDVGRYSDLTGTQSLFIAQDRVLSVDNSGIADKVYDLTVDGEHEFFANGILVHNCMDALRYSLTPIIRGHRLKMPEPNPQAEEEFFGRPSMSAGWMR